MKRAYGSGGIRKVRNGWHIRYRRNGHQHAESVAFALGRPAQDCTRADAERLLALRLHAHRPAVTLNTMNALMMDQAAVVAQVNEIGLRPSPALITGAELRTLVGPIVYAYFRRREPIYVGMSQHGIARPFGHGHQRLKRVWRGHPLRIQQEDHLVIWPMRSAAEALAAEGIVRDALMPRSATPAIRIDKAESFGLL